MPTPSQQIEIMRALHPRWEEFSAGFHDRVADLSQQAHRTSAEERELRAAMGFQAIEKAAGREGIEQFARWAIHDRNGFLFQQQSVHPLPSKLGAALQALLPHLPEPTPPVRREDPNQLEPGFTQFTRREIPFVGGGALLGIAAGNAIAYGASQASGTPGKLVAHCIGTAGGYVIGGMTGRFVALITESESGRRARRKRQEREAGGFVYAVEGVESRAKIEVIEPKLQPPTLDNVAQDMLHLLNAFYLTAQTQEPKAPSRSGP